MNLEALLRKIAQLEASYYVLLEKHQHLIHCYEDLKDKYEDRPGHRDNAESQEDSRSQDH